MATTPDRLYMIHLDSGDTVSAQFNPTEVSEEIDSVWRRIAIQGESHEPMEYDHTKNHTIEFELGFNTDSGKGITFGGSLQSSQFLPQTDARLVRRWLIATQYAPRGGTNIRQARPSRILLVWPNFYSISCRLTKVKFTHRQFESVSDGAPTIFSAELQFEADNIARLHYEDILEYGTERDDASGNTLGATGG